jgi:hypothetical protein
LSILDNFQHPKSKRLVKRLFKRLVKKTFVKDSSVLALPQKTTKESSLRVTGH